MGAMPPMGPTNDDYREAKKQWEAIEKAHMAAVEPFRFTRDGKNCIASGAPHWDDEIRKAIANNPEKYPELFAVIVEEGIARLQMDDPDMGDISVWD